MLATEGAHHAGCQRTAPVVIGLTGPIASGKSSVARLLQELGALVIDADDVYASLMGPGSPLLNAVSERFGPNVIRPDGELDRAALGTIVFGDRDALADLDRITHPAVVADVRRRIAQARAPFLAIEAVKLAQSGLLEDVDSLWLVTADQAARVSRLMKRARLGRDVARARVDASSDPLPDGVIPDVTIDNSGEWSATDRAVNDAWRSLTHNACNSLRNGTLEEEFR